MWVAETLGYPAFVVEKWSARELERWAAVNAIRSRKSKNNTGNGDKSPKSGITPESVTADESAFLVQAYLQQFGGRMM